MDDPIKQQLINTALDARSNAYAPYSKFPVGAAVLAKDGTINTGANVESASYGLTICAERVAAATAIATGQRELLAVAIASSSAAPPCGACRQFLAEFGSNVDVLLVDADDPQQVKETTLAKLLPEQFKIEKK